MRASLDGSSYRGRCDPVSDYVELTSFTSKPQSRKERKEAAKIHFEVFCDELGALCVLAVPELIRIGSAVSNASRINASLPGQTINR
jgi:hypothetical protein